MHASFLLFDLSLATFVLKLSIVDRSPYYLPLLPITIINPHFLSASMLFKALATLILTTLSLICSTASNAQERRVVTYQTVMSGSLIEIDAYVFDSVDEEPHFPGGDGAMMKFINRERKYPSEAYNAGIEGRVLCGFVVATDGTITAPEVIRGVEDSLNKEALRVISRMPRWVAGKIGDMKVPVYCILAIPFRR